MEKHEEKYCPQCNTKFVCKSGDIANCQCYNVTISEATQEFLLRTNFDCLCKNCLEQINRAIQVSQSYCFPTQNEMLVEGLHYYKENNHRVFTAFYHLLRGYCCQNGCRHCVYGYNKPLGSGSPEE